MKILVGITTIFQRQKQCAKVIDCLLQQTRVPDEIYVYVSSKPHLLDKGIAAYCLDPALYQSTQADKRVHVEWIENMGPYRKLLPLLKKGVSSDTILITCDDDTIYKKDFVEKAVRLYEEKQCCIGFLGTRIENTFAYNSFLDAKGTQSLWNLPKGCAGIVYSASWFTKPEVYAYKDFPTCDDLWFAAWRIAAGVECYIADETSIERSLSGATQGNLWSTYNESKNGDLLEKILHFFVYRGWIQGQDSFFTEESNLLFQWNRYIQTKLVSQIDSEPLEGNIWSKHTTVHPDMSMLAKQKNIVWLARRTNEGLVAEVGVNAGFSVLLFLLANPSIRMVGFDLGEHHYTRKCLDVLKEDFGDRIQMVYGDSRQTLLSQGAQSFEWIHIDGGHSEEVATSDLELSTKLIKSGGYMLLDDTNLDDVVKSVAKFPSFQETPLPYKTASHKHSLYKLN